jgi:hypothetical protein
LPSKSDSLIYILIKKFNYYILFFWINYLYNSQINSIC